MNQIHALYIFLVLVSSYELKYFVIRMFLTFNGIRMGKIMEIESDGMKLLLFYWIFSKMKPESVIFAWRKYWDVTLSLSLKLWGGWGSSRGSTRCMILWKKIQITHNAFLEKEKFHSTYPSQIFTQTPTMKAIIRVIKFCLFCEILRFPGNL